MRDLALPSIQLSAMSPASLAYMQAMEDASRTLPQVSVETHHVLHGGMYARTMKMSAGEMIVGALVKVPTIVIVEGNAMVWIGEETRHLTGYSVLPGSAGRKQAFYAIDDTHLTAIFPTEAKTVEEAEHEAISEPEKLSSRRDEARNHFSATGE